MKRQPLFFAYRQLLHLYPRGFRERFAAEMLEIAESAELSEWPVVLTDTAVTIVRSWSRPSLRRLPVIECPELYLGAEPALRPARFVQGLMLAAAQVFVACLISTQPVWHPPAYPDHGVCGKVPVRLAGR